jgi:TolB-like protein/Tfp pilus assembly protein PilF
VEFAFGDHLLDVDRRELRRGGELIALEPQVFDLLVCLVRNRDHVVTMDDVLEAVWGGRIVSESTLRSRINAVRNAVGDSGAAQRLIRTVPRKGIRFVGVLREGQKPEAPIGAAPVAAADNPPRPPLPLPDKPSIAVLPFANLSGDPEQEYFADGMVEEITTALSKVRWFFVIARNSSFTYKGRAVDVKQVGRELGVRYALEGSVRKSGSRVRISAQLIDAATGNHVWAERYDRELADIFAVQDEITERVVAAIEPELYAAEHFRSWRKPPENLDAWECVIRALAYAGEGTPARWTEAEALCRRAITIAPGYSQAHSLLAWMLIRATAWSGDVRTVLTAANTEAQTALGLDERDPWAHLTHGIVLWRLRRHSEAERAMRQALEFNPNFSLAHAFLSQPLAIKGAHQEALDNANEALRLSPKDPLVFMYAARAMAGAHFAAGNYSDGVIWARRAIERRPEIVFPQYLLIAAAAMQGDIEAASEALAALLRLQPGFTLAWADANMGFAGDVLERVLEGLRRAGVPEG